MRGYANRLLRTLATGCLLVFASLCWGAPPQLVIITGPQSPQLTFDQKTLRNVYLKRIYVDGQGHRLTPVNLPSGSPLREAFVSAVLHENDAQLQDYWDKQYFQGVSPPYVLASPDAVVRFVAKTPGAVGYVEPCWVDDSVRVVMTITLPPRLGDDLPTCTERHTP